MEDEQAFDYVRVNKWQDRDWRSYDLDDDGSLETPPLNITFSNPAQHWTDAIPIGNGRIGAMVWGGVTSETIQINGTLLPFDSASTRFISDSPPEDTLWSGIPKDYTDPKAPQALREVRKTVEDRRFFDATKEASKLFGEHSAIYQLFGELIIDFEYPDHAKPTSYHRELNLETAMATVNFSIGSIDYTREYFVSNPDQVLIAKLSSSKAASLSFTAHFQSGMHHKSYAKGNNQIILEGICPVIRDPPKNNANNLGIKYSGVVEVRTSNQQSVEIQEINKLKVSNCDWAVLLFSSASSFDTPFTFPSLSSKNPTTISLQTLNSIENTSFDELYARHLDDYQTLFHCVSLNLSSNKESEAVDTAERIKSFEQDEDPAMIELLFQFGRYLLISCSRPGTQVANLQGIWNKDLNPPWECAPHLNINLQMNYWSALPCNLKECQEPLFEFINSLSINGAKTSQVNYETRGWVAHHVSDIWAKTSPDSGDPVYATWPMSGAWLCTHLWEHYSFTMDHQFLRTKGYPLMKSCGMFLLDWLIQGPNEYLQTSPSTSPEHSFIAPDARQASVSYSTTMDISIIAEVFDQIVSAADVLGENDDAFVSRIRHALSLLPPMKISRDGSLMEWAEDFEDPEIHHRHMSHLFGLFPGHTLHPQKAPLLCKAAEISLIKRGEEGPGWSTVWKTALWARLRNGGRAYAMVKRLFTLIKPEREARERGGLYGNLFTAHPPFQIDANLGFPAAISEMLVQSTAEEVLLLPACPMDKWPHGRVSGLMARGGVGVSLTWNDGKLSTVGVWAQYSNCVTKLRYNDNRAEATLVVGKVYWFDNNLIFKH